MSAPDVRAVEAFLYREADLLDSWQLDDWLELFLPDATYEVPATDDRPGPPSEVLHLIADDMVLLKGRVGRLKSPHGYSENPPSKTRRFITNVRADDEGESALRVAANFLITRARKGNLDTYVGEYDHVLVADGNGSFKFQKRRAVLDLEALRPHGRITIIV